MTNRMSKISVQVGLKINKGKTILGINKINTNSIEGKKLETDTFMYLGSIRLRR